MKRIAFLLLAMCISIGTVWGTVTLPLVASALDVREPAEQHFEKAIELLKQWEYEAAIAQYEKVVNLAPKSEIAQDAQYWIGQCYFRMEQFDKALSIFGKLTQDYPESAIVPVTQLMIARVQQEKENEKLKVKRIAASDKSVIIDPKTEVKYTRIRTLTGKRDIIEHPAVNLSPSGKFLLSGVRVVPLDGGEPFDLTDIPAHSSAWSPDGKKVAFHSGEAIWVIPVSPETGRPTGTAKKLLDGKYSFQRVSWSPDSKRLVFGREDKEHRGDIWTLSVIDGALTQITDDPVWEGRPTWSPDGKTIAYDRESDGIWLVSAEGGTPRKIIERGEGIRLSWSPNDKWIFYTVRGKPHLFSLTNKHVFYITSPNEVGYFFSWSPDGRKMLFYRTSYDYKSALKVVSASGGPSFELGRQLTLWPYDQFWSRDSKIIIAPGETKDGDWPVFWRIPLAGNEPFLLESDISITGEPTLLSLSPDRKKLLFTVPQSDKTEDLWVVPISLKDGQTTGPAVKIFSGRDKKGRDPLCSWSPDGTELAVIHRGDIWIASIKGDKPVQITKTPGDEFNPVWSPNGKMIAHIYYRSEKEKPLMVISASGGKAMKILDFPVTEYAKYVYAWVPNSKEIVVFSKGSISAISMAGNKIRQIADLKELDISEAWGLCWSPDGQYLAFLGERIGREYETHIFTVPAEGGKVTELATDDRGDKYCLYWSPDGKWLSYNSDGFVKTRPKAAVWEADVSEIVSKLR